MPTLIAKTEPVVLVKYEMEYREKLKVKCFGPSGCWCKREKQWFFSWMLVYKCCPESDARIKTKSFQTEASSIKNGKCSMETLVGGIIPVVPEKYEFDYRKKTIIFNISQTFWLSAWWWKDHKNWFFNRIILYKCQAFDWDLDGTNQAFSCWEVSV